MDDAAPYSPGRRERRAPRAEERDASTCSPRPARPAIALAARQYQQATNMTDRMAALATLALHAGARTRRPRSTTSIGATPTIRSSSTNGSALQAVDPRSRDARPGAGADVASGLLDLQSEPRARADRRVRADATRPSSTGRTAPATSFSPTSSLELDPKNPQVAARLGTAFRSWRALEPVRRERAEAALRRIAAAPNLSRDLADIAGRSLDAA